MRHQLACRLGMAGHKTHLWWYVAADTRPIDSGIASYGEPCTMCAGAILRYGIARVIFGLREAQLMRYMTQRSGVVSYPSGPIFAMAGGRVDIVGGVLDDDARRPFELYVAKGRF